MKTGFMLLAAAAILTACSSPKNTYYTLNAPDLPATTALTHKTRVMVGPVTVPSLVDSPQLVLKDSANQVTIYEYHRWAGSLKTDIERVVAADLSRDLVSPNIWSYSQSPFAQFDYQKWSGLFEQTFLIYKWKTCGVTLPREPLAAVR